ncbi:MAG: glycoside hydrolase [Armatimonadetes bacterium]|nr:glycoside hydrolase [Armatimonadota bacterium]
MCGSGLRPREDETALAAQAERILRGNDVGDYTKPSPRLYPHQWNWDSAFIAIGWAHLDWERATREVTSLLRGQWVEGMIPHIRYNRAWLSGYFPGPEWWPGGHVRRRDELTSGISQPPVLASAVLRVGLAQPDAAKRLGWWGEVYAALLASLTYFSQHRVLGGSPLITVVHPWESGFDNSPRWDFALAAGARPSQRYRRIDSTIVDASLRPSDRDYDLYLYLAELLASQDYDLQRYIRRTPFAVYDTWFNAVWYRSAFDLNRVATALGQEAPFSAAELAGFAAAFRTTLWDEHHRAYLDFDLVGRRTIPVETCTSLMPIYAGLTSADEARALIARYRTRSAGCRLLPGCLPDQPGYEPRRYCRGPVWIHVNWTVIQGLRRLGCAAEARELVAETIDLVRETGFVECYDAETGAAAGARDFSWSAALVLDLLQPQQGASPDAEGPLEEGRGRW